MPLNVKAGGSWRTASKVLVRMAGAWREAKELFAYAAGGWKSSWKNEVTYINTANRTGASIYELMGSPTQPNIYVFENQATISAGAGSFALRTGVFPAGSVLKIVNKGYIRGRGGAGGLFNGAGGAGSDALFLDMDCSLDNSAGYVLAGGGGGGGAQWYYDGQWYVRTGGGGGAGSTAGAAGSPNSKGTANSSSLTINIRASAGTADAGGNGGVARASLNTNYNEVRGGAGGGPGAAGGASSSSQVNGNKGSNPQRYAGGAAGVAIRRNGKTITITAGNDTTRIKGAVV